MKYNQGILRNWKSSHCGDRKQFGKTMEDKPRLASSNVPEKS